jgi:hypothetical protein
MVFISMSNISFINPATYGEFKFTDSKNALLISHPNSKLVTPYDGVVVYDISPECEDSIKIKHVFDEDEVYSTFCYVGQSIVSNGDRVKQGDMIGKFGNKNINYFVVDSKNKKKSLDIFFNKKEKSKKNKTTTTTTTTTLNLQTDENPNPFMDAFLSPFSFASSIGQEFKQDIKNLFSKKKKIDDNDLNEEIVRIKKLMK